MSKHEKEVLNQFKKQAKSYTENVSVDKEKYIDWIIPDLELTKRNDVLDVAAGTAIFSRAMAPYVSEVTAVDYSPEMIEQGILEDEEAGITNIKYRHGRAEELTFGDESFDVVVCRLAFHHFEEPKQALKEMYRVLKPGGRLAVIDLLSPMDTEENASYNYYEHLRDPSHTKSLNMQEFLNLFKDLNIKVITSETIDSKRNLEDWLSLTEVDETVADEIKEALNNELEGGAITGLRPFLKENELMFTHKLFKIIGRKE